MRNRLWSSKQQSERAHTGGRASAGTCRVVLAGVTPASAASLALQRKRVHRGVVVAARGVAVAGARLAVEGAGSIPRSERLVVVQRRAAIALEQRRHQHKCKAAGVHICKTFISLNVKLIFMS